MIKSSKTYFSKNNRQRLELEQKKIKSRKSYLSSDGVSPQIDDCGLAVVGESVPVVMHDRPQIVGTSPRVDLRVAELVEVVPDSCELKSFFFCCFLSNLAYWNDVELNS